MFSSVKYVGHFPGKKDWGQKENREQPVVTYVTYIKDNRVSKGLVRKNRKINFQSCFVPFKKKKESIQQLSLKSSLPVVTVNIFKVNHITTN